jgi:hypothetical protein
MKCHRKESTEVVSGDRGGEVIGPPLPFHQSGNDLSKEMLFIKTPIRRHPLFLKKKVCTLLELGDHIWLRHR